MEQEHQLKKERLTLIRRIESLLEGPMAFLGFIWLGLLILEFIRGLNPALQALSMTIWIIFIIDFLLKLFLAPEKIKFLRKNWLTILSLIVPALRIFRFLRVFRLLRGLRSVRLVKVIGSLNRSMKALSTSMSRRGFSYVVILTLVVIFGGAAGMYGLESPGLKTYGEALYWTAMLLTSIGSEYWPQTPEGKTLCLILAIYGFCVFGYITATLASFFVGRDAEDKSAPVASSKDISGLYTEMQKLTQAITELKQSKDK